MGGLVDRDALVPGDGLVPFGLIPDDGLVTFPDGPPLLLDLDWRNQISRQSFPESASALAAILGAEHTASHIWTYDESASPLVDKVAAAELATNAGTPLFNQTAPGFWDGASMLNKRCTEFKVGDGRIQAADSDVMDIGASESFGYLLVYRVTETPDVVRVMLDKNTTGPRYVVNALTTGGIRFVLVDGGGSQLKDTASGPGVGSWGFAWCGRDVANSKIQMFTSYATAVNDALTVTGSLENAVGIALGSNNAAPPPFQIAYMAGFRGAAAEGFTQAKLDAFKTYAEQATTPPLTSYARASQSAPQISNVTGTGLGRVKYASGEVATAYNPNFSHSSKLGLLIEDARTNIPIRNEELDDVIWVKDLNMVVTGNNADAPDYARTAEQLAASGANDQQDKQIIVTAASTEYTAYVDVRRVGGSDVTGRLIIYNETGLAELAAQAFTATDEWTRVFVTATTAVGQVSTSIRVEVDNDGEAIQSGWAGLTLGRLSSVVPTTTASAARAGTTADLTNTGGNKYLKSAAGEIEIVCALNGDVAAAERYLLNADTGAANNDRIVIKVDVAGTVTAQIYDSAGTLKQTIVAADPGNWDQEHVIRLRWDSKKGIGANSENADLIIDGVRTAGTATAWTAGTNATAMKLGNTRSGTAHMNGILARFRVWAGPRLVQ